MEALQVVEEETATPGVEAVASDRVEGRADVPERFGSFTTAEAAAVLATRPVEEQDTMESLERAVGPTELRNSRLYKAEVGAAVAPVGKVVPDTNTVAPVEVAAADMSKSPQGSALLWGQQEPFLPMVDKVDDARTLEHGPVEEQVQGERSTSLLRLSPTRERLLLWEE